MDITYSELKAVRDANVRLWDITYGYNMGYNIWI